MSRASRPYYTGKRAATLSVLDSLAVFAVVAIITALLVHACVTAIDRDHEHHELTEAQRAAVVANW